MTDSHVQRLIDELLDSQCTPEEVCEPYPELLPEVRTRWRHLCRVRDELDALFPTRSESGGHPPARIDPTDLPDVPGYEVEAVLGRGGMGVVFRARHLRLKRVVALKMMLAGSYAGPRERERFQREAEVVARLRHPNVVQIHDVGDAGGRPYFTMEFVEGGSLARKTAGTPRPAREAAGLMAALADAVAAAHAAGIVHRDLKPANVLLTADGTPKISDFGLARQLDGDADLTRTGTLVGTPSYMAPEQAGGPGSAVVPAVDVYALGAILYELLTGRPPFRAETESKTLQQVIAQDPVPPSRLNASVPRDLETICLTCLRKEPRRRYASAAALADDLRRFLRGEAISARREGRVKRLVRLARRRPGLTAGLVSGTLVTAALIGGGLWVMSDRAAAAREREAERAATERAADADLREMVGHLKQSAWPEARAALERARGRLGAGGSAGLRRLLEQGKRDLDLAARLDEIRTGHTADQMRSPARLDEYEEAFREAGIGQPTDDPEAVAARVRASNIPGALVAALDHWSAISVNAPRVRWVLSVARLADPDPTGWRDRARDPATRMNLVALARVVQTAPVATESVPLLLALNKYQPFDSRVRLPFLRRVQQAHPGDYWANLTLGQVLANGRRPLEAVRYYQAAVAIRPRVPMTYFSIATAMTQAARPEEAVEYFRQAADLDPSLVLAHLLLASSLSNLGRRDEAIDQLRVAIRLNPGAAIAHMALGHALDLREQHAEALALYRQAVVLNQKNPTVPDAAVRHKLRTALARLGRGDEARTEWQAAIAADPGRSDARDGYAEFCLFTGQNDEYGRARKDLLARFGATTDPQVALRTARACLLRSVAGDELRQAVELAERAGGGGPAGNQPANPHVLFARGLAEYRQGRFDAVVAAMNGKAVGVLGPAPRLVLALALHRGGKVPEARKALAEAITGYDWRATQANDPGEWEAHVLRREAEAAILPDLPAFLEGKHQPRDNDERLALVGVCQFTNRPLALARLYTGAFEAAPTLAADFRAGHRINAARAAARLGSGRGADATSLGEVERVRWRQQARTWVRAELAAWNRALDDDPAATTDPLRRLGPSLWRGDADLAGLFDPAELDKLPADERAECVALGNEIGALLIRAADKVADLATAGGP